MTENPVLEAKDTIRNAELYVGRDMYIHTTLFKNRKYYAVVDDEFSSADLKIMNRYYSIEDILHLKTQNIPASAKVSFDTNYKCYVYNEDGSVSGPYRRQGCPVPYLLLIQPSYQFVS